MKSFAEAERRAETGDNLHRLLHSSMNQYR
jgi:hypothetical protein